MSEVSAKSLGVQTYEPEVLCGGWCQGGQVKMVATDYPEHTDAQDVWVRGSDHAKLRVLYEEKMEELNCQDSVIEKLEAQLAEARRDTKRLSYFDACRGEIVSAHYDPDGECHPSLDGHVWTIEGQFNTLREAIDADLDAIDTTRSGGEEK